jgi:hypothetical protein
MDEMIEIMHFSVSIFIVGVSSTSSLNVAQAPSHDGDASEKNHGLYPGMKFTTSLV